MRWHNSSQPDIIDESNNRQTQRPKKKEEYRIYLYTRKWRICEENNETRITRERENVVRIANGV